jgi:hypothetical protein
MSLSVPLSQQIYELIVQNPQECLVIAGKHRES